MDNSIDDAIETCNNKIDLHRGEASKLFRIIILSLLFFGAFLSLTFISNTYNQNKVSNFINELNSNSKKIDRSVAENEFLYSIISRPNNKFYKDSERIYYIILDSLHNNRSDYDSVISNLKKLPINLQSSLLTIDNTAIYIFYGIFILVFGILTSFYRFHLKEVSKYEHFLFGFQRIRIAGNNSITKYDDEVKVSLARDAFTTEQKKIFSKEKKIESPIPGHPSSDALTFLMNKIFNAIDITAKPKHEKSPED